MNRRISSFLIALSLVAIAAGSAKPWPQDQAAPATGVVLDTLKERWVIDPASGKRVEVRDEEPGDRLSPDGKRIAFIGTLRFAEHTQEALMVAPVPVQSRTEARSLSMGAKSPGEPRWMPDSKHIAYVRGRGHHRQVYLTDATAEKLSERRVSRGKKQSWQPRVRPDGRISFLELRERKGKEQLVDLVVWKDGKYATIVKNQPITCHAWSPDGSRLAYGTQGALHLMQIDTGKTKSTKLSSIDERLYSHHVQSMAWHHDGDALAARIAFSGGRAAEADDQMPVIYGDEELFIIPLEGDVRVLPVPAKSQVVAWTAAAN